jgi:PEP-CTERM motif
MRLLDNAVLAGLAGATFLTSAANASMIYVGPSPAMATDQSFSLNFNSASATSGLSFVLDGYGSLDGKNAYEDDFSLRLNNQQVFLGTFNMGGGSNSGSQANVYSNPFGASFSNLTNNGTGIGWSGGKEFISFAALPFNVGLNTLTFFYTSLSGPGYAGFQGIGDEAWGVEKVGVSATPLPASWTMLLLGLGGFGFFAHRRQRKARALVDV